MSEVTDIREQFAAQAHASWSDWMIYMFGKCTFNNDGTMTIPKWAVDRWTRQARTLYNQLPEDEKESDLEEADKYFLLLPRFFVITREQLAAAQSRITELANALDRKNDVIEGWRSECAEHADARATAEKRVAELEAERADLLCAAQWFEGGRGRTRYFGNDDEMILARMEQARNNERASEIIRRAALAGVEPATRGE